MLSLIVFLPLLGALIIILLPTPEKQTLTEAQNSGNSKNILKAYKWHVVTALSAVGLTALLSIIATIVFSYDDSDNLATQIQNGEWGDPGKGTFRLADNYDETQEIFELLQDKDLKDEKVKVALTYEFNRQINIQTQTYNAILAGDLSEDEVTPRYAGNFQFVEFTTWISLFDINYFMAVDGISMPMVLLTGILGVLALFASFTTTSVMQRGFKGYLALFLLLETGLLGVFVAMDFFLFYVFWEVVLLPMYFLIGIWGSREKKNLFGKLIEGRIYSSLKFFIYTLVGSVLMLLVMLFTYYHTGSFNMLVLMNQLPNLALDIQKLLFMGLFVAFAIKVPLFPFHTWLPDAHVDAPTPISMILAGVLLKMGGYGFFRFSYPMLPDAASYFIWVIVTIALINIIYGALAAMGQKDFKKLVAYSSVSHMGYVLLGLAAMTSLSANGAVMQMFNHGISSAMMFFVVGVLYERAHHRKINEFGGIALGMPYYAGLATVAFFASLGLPGLNGFISEAMVFIGSFQAEPLRIAVIIASLGIVLTAAYLLWAWQRIFHGTHKKAEYENFKDLNKWEWATLVPLAAMCLIVGILPHLIVNIIDPAINYLVALF